MYKLIDTGKETAQQIMARDTELLASLHPDDVPILHLYEWNSPSATYGYFIDPSKHFLLANVEKLGFSIAKRPTGGGILFHTCDLAFSLLLPSSHSLFSAHTLESYANIHQFLSHVIDPFVKNKTSLLEQPTPCLPCAKQFCFAHPTKYDLLLNGKKVIGAAQRKTKRGLLHQGSIMLSLPDPLLLKQLLIEGETLFETMSQESHPLLGPSPSPEELSQGKTQIRDLLKKSCSSL